MEEVRRSVCALDCPDACSLLVTVQDGRATRLRGDPEHPITRGFLCAKVSRYLAWGANILGTNVHLWPFIVEARRNGAKFYVIDPHRNRTGKLADKHFFINPGSDAALAFGMMHVLIGENLYDADYVERYTSGFG